MDGKQARSYSQSFLKEHIMRCHPALFFFEILSRTLQTLHYMYLSILEKKFYKHNEFIYCLLIFLKCSVSYNFYIVSYKFCVKFNYFNKFIKIYVHNCNSGLKNVLPPKNPVFSAASLSSHSRSWPLLILCLH